MPYNRLRMNARKPKVICAMSGGVDSSVAAALLKQRGYEVIGVFMRLGSPAGVGDPEACSVEPVAAPPRRHKQGCCSVLDATDARRVAGVLDIPLYVLNFEDEFDRVIDYFVSEYNAGRTPNPCVRCNDWLKFGRLAQYAQAIGADFVASGHYARIGPHPVTGEKSLLRGVDHQKDQSYVLFGMNRITLEHTLLPVGDFEKPAVRQIAEGLGLPTFNKPDSQEICFVPNQDYAGLLRRRAPQAFRAGQLVDTTGHVVGAHEGHQQFTIGQRKGVGVALGYPVYVVDVDPGANRVTVGERSELLRRGLVARQINLLSNDAIGENRPCTAKIRYNSPPQPARCSLRGTDELEVIFDQPQAAVTPGQAVVIYEGEVVLGGGWIERSIR